MCGEGRVISIDLEIEEKMVLKVWLVLDTYILHTWHGKLWMNEEEGKADFLFFLFAFVLGHLYSAFLLLPLLFFTRSYIEIVCGLFSHFFVSGRVVLVNTCLLVLRHLDIFAHRLLILIGHRTDIPKFLESTRTRKAYGWLTCECFVQSEVDDSHQSTFSR